MTRTLHAILSTPAPSAPAELPEAVASTFWGLAASDWVTIVASLVVGLGAAWISSRSGLKRDAKTRASEKAQREAESTDKRRTALRNYEREIDDLLDTLTNGQITDSFTIQRHGPPKEFRLALSAAHPHLSELPDEKADQSLRAFRIGMDSSELVQNLRRARTIVREELGHSHPSE